MLPRSALALLLAASVPALAGVTVSNVVSSGNGGAGIRVKDAATVAAHDVVVTGNHGGGVNVAAGRLDIDGASQIGSNQGGSPVAFGVKVAPGAILTLTG